jgi:hypothetical protein
MSPPACWPARSPGRAQAVPVGQRCRPQPAPTVQHPAMVLSRRWAHSCLAGGLRASPPACCPAAHGGGAGGAACPDIVFPRQRVASLSTMLLAPLS